MNSKCIKDLNIRPGTINSEENISSSLTSVLGMIFLDLTPKAEAAKAKINK